MKVLEYFKILNSSIRKNAFSIFFCRGETQLLLNACVDSEIIH